MTPTTRSLAPIGRGDLLRLGVLAAEAEAGLFARHPHGAGRYAGRLLCRALCQGAALHFLDGKNGVKDFDVWSFYAALDDGPFPYLVAWHGQLRPVQVRPLSRRPAVVHRTARRLPRTFTACAARHRPGSHAARLPVHSAHSNSGSTSRQGSHLDQPRPIRRRVRLALSPTRFHSKRVSATRPGEELR